jgi:hypothetical protein
MAQTFFPVTVVEVSPGTASAWTDVDVSAYVPSGATGVILHYVNTSSTTTYALGLRKNGSTDARTQGLYYGAHCWAAIGIDASRIFEAYIGDTTYIDIYLVGYTMSGVTFFTNAYDKSLTATAAWTDISCVTEAPSAVGLIFEVVGTSASVYAMGFRKNGSTDNRTANAYYHDTFGVIIGCDASQICEGYIGNVAVDFFLVGYITDGCTFNTNATDVSLSTTATWLDLTALPATANMGFIEVNTATTYNYGLRKNGSAENIYKYAALHPWAFVECDASQIIEGEIANVAVDFFVVGYATAVTITTYELSCSDGLKVGDTPATLRKLYLSLTDGLKSGDSGTVALAYYLALTDGLKLGDATTLQRLLYLTLAEGIKTGDTSTARRTLYLSLLDGVKLGDTTAIALAYYLILTDGIKLGDTSSAIRSFYLILADGIKAGDTTLATKIFNLLLTDGLKLGDTATANLVFYLALVDGIKAGDTSLAAKVFNLLLSDGIKLGDILSYEKLYIFLTPDKKIDEHTEKELLEFGAKMASETGNKTIEETIQRFITKYRS